MSTQVNDILKDIGDPAQKKLEQKMMKKLKLEMQRSMYSKMARQDDVSSPMGEEKAEQAGPSQVGAFYGKLHDKRNVDYFGTLNGLF